MHGMAWLARLFGSSFAPADGPPAALELYTRAGCHLCEVMKAEIAGAGLGARIVLREVDIAGDAELEARYGRSIPVLTIDGRVAFKGRLTADELRAKLDRYARDARRSRDTARDAGGPR